MSNPNQRTEAAEAAVSGAAAGAAAGAHEVMSNFVQELQRSATNASKDSSGNPGNHGVDQLNKMGDGSVSVGKDAIVNSAKDSASNAIKDGASTSTRDSSGKDAIRNGDKCVGDLESVLGKLRIHDQQTVSSDRQGVIGLNTGDKLVRVNGTEILVMPDGGTLQVNKDGSYDLDVKGGAKISHDEKTGATTITLKNGDTIEMRNGHIREVNRGFETAHMNSAIEDVLNADPGIMYKDGKVPNIERSKPLDNSSKPNRTESSSDQSYKHDPKWLQNK